MKVSPAKRHRVAVAFGAAFKAVRQQRGKSHEDLADDAGLDRTTFSLWERALRTPTLITLFEVADALRVEPTQLVADTVQRIREAP